MIVLDEAKIDAMLQKVIETQVKERLDRINIRYMIEDVFKKLIAEETRAQKDEVANLILKEIREDKDKWQELILNKLAYEWGELIATALRNSDY